MGKVIQEADVYRRYISKHKRKLVLDEIVIEKGMKDGSSTNPVLDIDKTFLELVGLKLVFWKQIKGKDGSLERLLLQFELPDGKYKVIMINPV